MPQIPNITVQLVHIQGPMKGQIQDFTQFPVQIGRHSSCQVRFEKDLTTISRRHARIERQGNRFRIVDSSTNGTYINGKRIADVYLRDGDVITFSESGPKASFLTKIEALDAPMPTAPSIKTAQPAAPIQPQMSSPAGVPQQMAEAAHPAPPHPSPNEPGLTVGPDLDVPVVSTNAPLVIQFGPTLQSYNLLPVTVGTDPACDFVIANSVLSGRHLQIFFNDNDYYAKDLTGRKMITINGRPVGTQAVLAQGAELSLSDHGPKFRFLGGGRLAELPDVVSEPLEKTDADPNLQGSDRGLPTAEKKGRKANSLFKNFFS
ncbi:FHA domain-containing protein [Desulfosarcina sp.]|uniref:FHA domain-containing protein n=1 Tax=Desulfosarcina sp. TaxID=2027861 RepID=UPI003970ABCD